MLETRDRKTEERYRNRWYGKYRAFVRDNNDPERLGRWMDEQHLPGAGEAVTSRFVSGGASNEIFEIRRGEHRWAP